MMNFSNIWNYKIFVPPLISNYKLNKINDTIKINKYYIIYSQIEYILVLLNTNCIKYIENIKIINNGYINNNILHEIYFYIDNINNIYIFYNEFIKKISKKYILLFINNNNKLKILFAKFKYNAIHITNLCYYLINKCFINKNIIYKNNNYFDIKNIIIIIFKIINYFDINNEL